MAIRPAQGALRGFQRRCFLLSLLLILGLIPGMGCGDQATPVVEEAPPPVPAEVAEEPVADEAMRPRPPAGDRSVAERVQDQALATRIRIALARESTLRPFDFAPEVGGGAVVLYGRVQTAEQRDRALAVARGVEGVRSLTSAVEATEAPAPADPPPLAEAEAPPPDPAPDTAALAVDEPAPPPTAAPEPEPAAAPADEPQYHTVRSGESLWIIARANGLSVGELRRLNDLRSDNLRPGQRLRVK